MRRKKDVNRVFVLAGVMLIAIIALSILMSDVYNTGFAIKEKEKRVVIKPFSKDAENKILALGVNVSHKFKDKFSANVPEGLISKISTMASVENVKEFKIMEKERCSPSENLPWNVRKLNGGQLNAGSGIKIAVLDTGIKRDHPDFYNDIKLCADTTTDHVKNGCDDKNGHGTHVAGIAAANAGRYKLGIFGVAPNATLYIIKVCNNNGICLGDDISEGIRHAVDKGANIISMSFGGNEPDALIKEAIDYAYSKGVLMVAAAGNQGPDVGVLYPAYYAKVISVAAVDKNDQVPYWSSRGNNNKDYSRDDNEIEFAAPGGSIESTWDNKCYMTLSGTSMATPHISGLAAKLWGGSADSTRAYLRQLAMMHDLGEPGEDSSTGFGMPVAP